MKLQRMPKMQFNHPCTIIVAGPTKAGKTCLVRNFVLNCNAMFSPPPGEILWCYSQWQPLYNDLVKYAKFVQGLPDLSELKKNCNQSKLLILDDLMQDVQKKSLAQLFTQGCHHWNITCIHIVQNLFYGGLRTSRVNAQYIILMKNPSDKLQAMNLAKQIVPGKVSYFLESYEEACTQPYGYLVIDLSQDTPEYLKLRTNIFPGQTQIAYVPKV